MAKVGIFGKRKAVVLVGATAFRFAIKALHYILPDFFKSQITKQTVPPSMQR